MTDQSLPFSQACENNKAPILEQLMKWFEGRSYVLEIGSGTGQHAVHFAKYLTWLKWQTSDQPHYHPGIAQWIDAYPSENVLMPIALTIGINEWPNSKIDAVFSANTAHIMQRQDVKRMMAMIEGALPQGGVFCQYGPFTQSGQFSSESNQQFHLHLLSEGCGGYRDIEELIEWSPSLTLREKIEMPANNLLLVWEKR